MKKFYSVSALSLIATFVYEGQDTDGPEEVTETVKVTPTSLLNATTEGLWEDAQDWADTPAAQEAALVELDKGGYKSTISNLSLTVDGWEYGEDAPEY